mgnify:FL=1
MPDKSLTPRAIKDFQDIESEINALMTIALAREFSMREESINSKFKRQAFMLYILFCNQHMHRYGSDTNNAIRTYFSITPKVFNSYNRYHMSEMYTSAKRLVKTDKAFKQLYTCLKNVGIKMVTEGWVGSPAMQVQYIDRQIDILRVRKKTIQKETAY